MSPKTDSEMEILEDIIYLGGDLRKQAQEWAIEIGKGDSC